MRSRFTFCRICEAVCGLEALVEGDRVVKIRPDRDHVTTRGFACIKGLKQHEIYGSPDRVRRPMRRVGRHWVEATWLEAMADIGGRLASIRGAGSPDAIALYVGTAAGFSTLHPLFAQGFATGLGTKSVYSSATQDCASKFAAARELYGFPFLQPFADVDRTDCLVLVGSNPSMSKWSFGHLPNAVARLRGIVARGGRVYVVDPRRTETARAVGEHVAIRPGTDVFFYLSFLHEVFAQGFVERPRVAAFMSGLAEVEALAQGWPPERTAGVTGIGVERLRRIVSDYGRSGRAAMACSTGVNLGGQGTVAFWLQEVINAITGNLDRCGGTLVGRPRVDAARWMARGGAMMRDDRSRIGGFPSVNDGFPGGVLADEIFTPGRRRVRALISTGGNPVMTMPGGARLREALASLELLVVIDVFRNETAEHAHWVLPATSPLERPDLLFAFPLFFGIQSVPYAQATERVVPPVAEVRDEATIYTDLARAAGVSLFGSASVQRTLEVARRSPRYQEILLAAMSRGLGWGSLRRLLREAPHGRRLPDHRGEDFLGQRVLTDDGLVHLAPPSLLDAAMRLDAVLDQERRSLRSGTLRLIGRRATRTHNSWTHNLERFVARFDGRTNYLGVHPDDAARLSLAEGDLVDVISSTDRVRVPCTLDADLMPGVVSLPHGWGHQAAPGLRIARDTAGVNVNLLAASGPDALDPLSGMARLTAIDVEIRRAEGPRNRRSWSGI